MKDQIVEVVRAAFDVDVQPVLTHPDAQFGDFSTNVAMQLAGKLGKNPREIAEVVAEKLRQVGAVTEVTVAGPGYINIRVRSDSLAENLSSDISEVGLNSYGASKIGQNQTVICEFPSPNMAKPYSVGHMRPAFQGWAIYKLYSKFGYNVITDNHLGDSGTPFGKWVVGFLRYSSEEKLNIGGIEELSRVYIQISADLKAEKAAGQQALADEVQVWLQKLEAGDEEAISYSQRFNKISLDHMHEVMARLRIHTDHELGESFYVARAHQMVDELLDRGIAEVSDGAVIVRLDDYGIDVPALLRKANGTVLYATTDLATIEYRQNTWQPKKVFIHTGQEQAFYFTQLNALAKKCGLEANIVHLWHGLIDQKNEDGTREKMSSRKGVVLLNDLLDHAEEKAREFVTGDNDETVKAVALGALKFSDFSADRKSGALFDWQTMFNVHGFSGPAVQYAAVRIRSILAKAADQPAEFTPGYDWASEHKLLLKISDYPQLLADLHGSYEMHKLATYAYELGRELNRYYETTQVLKAESLERTNRLWLLRIVEAVLVDSLDILGIPTPEEM